MVTAGLLGKGWGGVLFLFLCFFMVWVLVLWVHSQNCVYCLCDHSVRICNSFFLSFLRREAVALARVRLSPLDPVLEDLYTDWSEQLMRDGAYEQAAKWYGLNSDWLTDGRALTVIGLLMVRR